jgi:hypothetical protein
VTSACSDLFAGTAVDDRRLELILDLAGTRASSLKFRYDFHALLVSDLAENDVLAIEPGGDDGGDEELRAVPAVVSVLL